MPHNWQPLTTAPHGKHAAVPQHQCSECGVCRAYPDPTEPTAAQYWRLPPYPGAASSQPSEDEPPCNQ